MALSQTIPALPVIEIAEAVNFYRDRLGFEAGYSDASFAVLVRDAAKVHLWAARDHTWKDRELAPGTSPISSGAESFLAGTASCRIQVDGLAELFGEYTDSGVLYSRDTTIRLQPWGESEFPVLDLHRNLLTFFESARG